MLYEFAVEPDALGRWGPLWQALEQFGIPHGRMISRFPAKWQRLVYEATVGCSNVERAMLEVRLKALSAKLLASGRTYDAGKPWRENAQAAHGATPFHAVIQADNPRNEDHVLTPMDLHEGQPRWSVRTQYPIARTPTEMANCIAPLCSISRELLFVDPHFFLAKNRFSEVFGEFMRRAHCAGRSYQRIEVHTATDAPRAHFERETRITRPTSSESPACDWLIG